MLRNKKISFWIKSLIFLLAASLLYYILRKNDKLDEAYYAALLQGWEEHSFLLIISALLIPVNWSLEAYKWKYLISKIERISFLSALQGIITGVTMGFVTPHSLGDYVARILTLTNEERSRGIGAVLISRISQFYITLYFGTVSMAVYIYYVVKSGTPNDHLVIWVTVLSNILFVLIFIYHNTILRVLEKWKLFQKLIFYFEVIKTYSFQELNYVLLLSFVRYLVFCAQFVLILIAFGIALPWWLMLAGVAFIFFVKSVIPTFLDLGVRETAAVIFFGVFSSDHQNIVFASLTLWLLNLVLPAIIGLFLIFRMKLFKA
jgi:uncharacterized membrane protein YbhN (UPF0104 family)